MQDSFPTKTNSAQLFSSFPRPTSGAPLGRNQGRSSRIRPRSPYAGFLSGRGCGRSALRGADTARSGRLPARCGARGARERPHPTGAWRPHGWLLPRLGIFPLGDGGMVVSAPRARDTCNTKNGVERVFCVHTPIPPSTDRHKGVEREEEYIFFLFFLSFPQLSPQNICRHLCRRYVGTRRQMGRFWAVLCRHCRQMPTQRRHKMLQVISPKIQLYS